MWIAIFNNSSFFFRSYPCRVLSPVLVNVTLRNESFCEVSCYRRCLPIFYLVMWASSPALRFSLLNLVGFFCPCIFLKGDYDPLHISLVFSQVNGKRSVLTQLLWPCYSEVSEEGCSYITLNLCKTQYSQRQDAAVSFIMVTQGAQ